MELVRNQDKPRSFFSHGPGKCETSKKVAGGIRVIFTMD
jgi:hypothetical protein